MDRLRIALHVGFGAAILALLLFASVRPAIAHGGGIDAYGGHNEQQEGELSLASGHVRWAHLRFEGSSYQGWLQAWLV